MQTAVPASAAVPAPTDEEHGILVAGSRTPLTLTSCSINATLCGPSASVQLDMTYRNQTNKDVPVVAAAPAPVGWTIVGYEVAYDGCSMTAVFAPVEEQATGAKAGGRDGAPADIVVPTTSHTGTATVALPFTVAVGTGIVLRITYLVLLSSDTAATSQTGRLAFHIPADLVPLVRRPPPMTAAYSGIYALLNQPQDDGLLHLRVCAASLPCPLRGEARLHTASPVNQLDLVPLACQVDYHGDSAFVLACTLPLPEATSAAAPSSGSSGGGDTSYRGGPLFVSCDTQDTIEPLRIFVEAPPAEEEGGADEVPVAIAATLTATGLEGKVGDIVNSEYVFVIDSHHTATSAAAGHALALALRALPASIYVNVAVLSGEGHTMVYPASSTPVRQVDLASLQALVSELNPQSAGPGGPSHLLDTLRLLLPEKHRSVEVLPRIAGYVRHIVLLSDNATVPSSTAPATVAAIVRDVSAACGEVRLSAVAVTAANTSAGQHPAAGLALLETLSRCGNGCFVEAPQPTATAAAAALVSVLAATAIPALTGLKVSFGGEGEDEVRPALAANAPLPAIPSGCTHTIYALAAAGAPAAVSVHVTGKVGAQVVEFMGTSSAEGAVPPSAVPSLARQRSPLLFAASTARIRALLAADSAASAAMGEVVHLSCTVGVPSPFTRLVLRRSGDRCDASRVTVPPAASFASATAAAECARTLAQLATLHRKWVAALAARRVAPSDTAAVGRDAPPAPAMLRTVDAFVPVMVAQEVAARVAAEPSLEGLLELQERDGSFPLSAALALAVGVRLDAVEAAEPVGPAITPKTQMSAAKRALWATVVAVAFMEAQAQPIAALALRAAIAHLYQECPAGEWKEWLAEAQDLLGKRTDTKA